jgi:hypothetical protein
MPGRWELGWGGACCEVKPLPFRRGGTSPPDWSERLHGVGVGYIGLRNADRPHPFPPLKGRGDLGNYRDICVIPEIALSYDGSGRHLLFVFASLCEIILALGFHLHERGVVRGR